MSPFTIYTGCATNNGYYLALAVAARDEAQAMRAFRPWLKERKQYVGNYVFESGLTARLPDEQGDYPNDGGSGSVDLSRCRALFLLNWPLRPKALDAGWAGNNATRRSSGLLCRRHARSLP